MELITKRFSFLSVAVVIAIQMVYSSYANLLGDEAYYWVYAQHPSLSYFDHPPMIAYLILLATKMGGNNPFSVRLPSLFSTTMTVLTLYWLAKRMYGQRIANVTLLLALANPLIEASFFAATPDSPLMMFCILTFTMLYLALFEKKEFAWYWAGFFAGCALLSKYTAIALFPGLLLFLILYKHYRQSFSNYRFYIAALIAVLVFSPVIVWNIQHHFASFDFQWHHGVQINKPIQWLNAPVFLCDAALVCNPILFFAFVYYFIKIIRSHNRLDTKLMFLLLPSLIGFTIFFFFNMQNMGQANWPAPVYLSLIIVLAKWLSDFQNKWVCNASFVLMITVMIILPFILLLPTRSYFSDRYQRLYNIKKFMSVVRSNSVPGTITLGCDDLITSKAAFYLDPNQVYMPPHFPKMKEFYYYKMPPWDKIKNAPSLLYVCERYRPNALMILQNEVKPRKVALLDMIYFKNAKIPSYIYRIE